MDGRQDAGGQADARGKQDSHSAELHAGRPGASDQLDNRLGRTLEGDAEVAVERAPHVQAVLFVQRPVEPVLVEDVLFGGRWERCLLLVERPAWNRVHEHECQHRDDRENDEDAGEAAEEVDNHGGLVVSRES